ncbi:MAG: M15 family metallopeptidase [Eubacteriales bacterium]
MKKIVLILLSIALLFCGCGNNADSEEPTPTSTDNQTEDTSTSNASVSSENQTAEEGEAYKIRVNEANVRSTPNKDSKDNVIGTLGYEEKVRLISSSYGEYSKVKLEDGQYGYVYTDFLVKEDEVLYAVLPKQTEQKKDKDGNLVYEEDGVTPVMLTNNLVDVRLYVPSADISLIFATDENFTGKVLYKKAVPLLQLGTAKKLKKAADLFAADGYTIRIYDAYRPLSVQKILYNIRKNSSYIANPETTASNHNRGAAVDMSLLDANGNELEFPTEIHTLNEDANRGNDSWSETAKENVDYMTSIMKKAGFDSISSEWWHFSDTDCHDFMTTDIDFSSITMVTKDYFK